MKHIDKPASQKIRKAAPAEGQESQRDEAGQLTFFEVIPVHEDAASPAQLNAPAKSDTVEEPSASGVMEWRLPVVRAATDKAELADLQAAAAVETAPSTPKKIRGGESLSQRLSAAREVRGWSRKDVADKLHLPSQIVGMIETEQYEPIGHGVYLRGYLTSYARLVDVPVAVVENVLRQHASTPELVASGRVSHSRYLIDRYSGSALYVVLTGLIVVPFVMFAMNMGSDVGARLTPLDVSTPASAPANADVADAGKVATSGDTAATSTVKTGETPVPATPAASDSPLMASFTPFPNPSSAQAEAPQASAPASEQIRLSLNEASWVEIVDADGMRLEYATLPAGTIKTYASDKALDVRLGNTNGATLEVNGAPQDMTPYNRGNVAHFRLLAGSATISRE